jgi:hypothetical protein
MRREAGGRGRGGSRLVCGLLALLVLSACEQKARRNGIPAEVESVVGTVSEQIAQEQYEKVYNDASELWKKDATLEQSTETLKTLHTKLGKIESRVVNSANDQQNSSGPMKGHIFIVTYQSKFERGEAMETFTLIEENGRWKLARYLVNSTALK